MKTSSEGILAGKSRRSGYAIVTALMVVAVTMIMLSGILKWTSSNAFLTDRQNEYLNTVAAAESATEKVLAYMGQDYQKDGERLIAYNFDNYEDFTPRASENSIWDNYTFSDGSGESSVQVEKTASVRNTLLDSKYAGLYGLASDYEVSSFVRNNRNGAVAGIKQEIQLASIPIFQYAIFYSVDLEFHPGPDMIINGRVHGNSDVYLKTETSKLTLQSDVTAAGNIIHGSKTPGKVVNSNGGQTIYMASHDSGVSSLTLPVGTDNSPEAVREILNIPPLGESTESEIGQQRYYNKTDLIVEVYDGATIVKSGAFDGFNTSISWDEADDFLSIDKSIYDYREGKTMVLTEIDVEKFDNWISTNSTFTPLLGRTASSVYIADMRSASSSVQPAVRVVNGETLPDLGLTVATPNPLYVQGHFNAPGSSKGTHNTSLTKPASFAADAISVLSENWNDSNSANSSLSGKTAADTTVNAAFLSGIVPTTSSNYSGGVENYPRFLENWSGKKLTYNGSMVVLFNSEVATGEWKYGGNIYNAPGRDWAFDVNFLDPEKLPPATPAVRSLVRGKWTVESPEGVVFDGEES